MTGLQDDLRLGTQKKVNDLPTVDSEVESMGILDENKSQNSGIIDISYYYVNEIFLFYSANYYTKILFLIDLQDDLRLGTQKEVNDSPTVDAEVESMGILHENKSQNLGITDISHYYVNELF